MRGTYAIGSPWGALSYRDSVSVWGVYTPNDAYIGGTLVMPDGGPGGRVLTIDQYGYSSWEPPADMALPYSGTTWDVGSAFEIRNDYGTAIKGTSPMVDAFTAAVSGGDTTGNLWGALGYRDGALGTWGVFTPNRIYAFDDIISGNGDGWFGGNVITSGFQMDTGAAAGYVLTSDADGFASWQQPPGGRTSTG